MRHMWRFVHECPPICKGLGFRGSHQPGSGIERLHGPVVRARPPGTHVPPSRGRHRRDGLVPSRGLFGARLVTRLEVRQRRPIPGAPFAVRHRVRSRLQCVSRRGARVLPRDLRVFPAAYVPSPRRCASPLGVCVLPRLGAFRLAGRLSVRWHTPLGSVRWHTPLGLRVLPRGRCAAPRHRPSPRGRAVPPRGMCRPPPGGGRSRSTALHGLTDRRGLPDPERDR